MLVNVPADEVRLGMFVHGFGGSWMDHPFWRTKFMLSEQVQLEKIRASSVEYVIIDDGKGLAPEPQDNVHSLRPVAHSPSRETETRAPAPRPAARWQPDPKAFLSPKERAIEFRKASGAINRSKAAVMEAFADARLGKAIRTKKMRSLVEQISNSVSRDPAIILNIAKLKTKDEYTYLHSVAVCALMINLARTMNLDEAQVEDIGMAGLLHDIGKMAIPDDILMKPGRLDDREFETVRSHPERGHEILASSSGIPFAALDVCLHHHEKMDGTGYPKRLDGSELSLVARMSAICDVYDAITSQRPYNEPWTASEALSKMASWNGHFDKLIFKSFVESLGITPVGTLVRLNTDQLAIVTGESPADFTLPLVRIFYDIDTGREMPPADLEILRSGGSRSVAAIEEPEDWGFDDWPTLSARLLTAPSRG